jgi:hypothetical protein
MVYTREAHPHEGATEIVRHTRTLAQRRRVAQDFARREGLTMPVVLDTMDDSGYRAFEVQTSTIFVVDAAGKLVYRSGAPYSLDPDSLIGLFERYTRPASRTSPPAPPI